jgi:hypothetical protein
MDGNHSIEIYDSSNSMVKGVLKAVGTSEGLGATLNVSNCANSASGYDTLDGASPSGFRAIKTQTAATARAGTVDELAVTSGWLLKSVFNATLTSGSAPLNSLLADFGGTIIGKGNVSTTSGSNIRYDVVTSTTTGVFQFANTMSDVANFTIADLVMARVLTPSSSGATIVSAKQGSTYNWTVKNSAFSFNQSSYFVVIKAIRGEVVVASGDITAGNALIDSTTANAFAAPVGVDLSAYQTGKYRLDLYQTSTGILWAQGFISATAPSGEALEATNRLTNGDMELDANWVNSYDPTTNERSIEQVHGGTYSRKWVGNSNYDGIGQPSFYPTSTDGALYKSGGFVYPATETQVSMSAGSGRTTTFTVIAGQWNEMSAYFTPLSFNNMGNFGFNGTAGHSVGTFYADDAYCKRVTMPAATGALLLSSYGGSRGFVFKHASLNPNAALSYKIVKVID